jgi:hypothetical protein
MKCGNNQPLILQGTIPSILCIHELINAMPIDHFWARHSLKCQVLTSENEDGKAALLEQLPEITCISRTIDSGLFTWTQSLTSGWETFFPQKITVMSKDHVSFCIQTYFKILVSLLHWNPQSEITYSTVQHHSMWQCIPPFQTIFFLWLHLTTQTRNFKHFYLLQQAWIKFLKIRFLSLQKGSRFSQMTRLGTRDSTHVQLNITN